MVENVGLALIGSKTVVRLGAPFQPNSSLQYYPYSQYAPENIRMWGQGSHPTVFYTSSNRNGVFNLAVAGIKKMNGLEKFIYLLVLCVPFLFSCDSIKGNSGYIWKEYEYWPPENVEYILSQTLLYSLRNPDDHRESPGVYILTESYFDYKAVPSTFWFDCESSLELERAQVDDFAMSGIFRCDAGEGAWRIVVCVYNKFDRERRYEATYRYDQFRAVFFSEIYEVEGQGYFMPPGNLGLCRVA